MSTFYTFYSDRSVYVEDELKRFIEQFKEKADFKSSSSFTALEIMSNKIK